MLKNFYVPMTHLMAVIFFIILVVNSNLCSAFNKLDLEEFRHGTLDEWFDQVNMQYRTLNQYSALYMWELSTNPSNKLINEASDFGAERSKWINGKCLKAESMAHDMSRIQKRMIQLLCRGPKYTKYQGSQLSDLLAEMQAIYTETQLCLPYAFDICINYNRIWDYTYIRTPNKDILTLNMSAIVTDRRTDHNQLHFFDGQISSDYYVFRGMKNVFENEEITDQRIRNSKLLCLNIEPELENLIAGNFSTLQRPDCALPTDIVFRWAWEAWHLAVGPEIAKYYPSAVYFMNLGANNNGYNDIGETWREELEIKNLRQTINKLWSDFKPYYKFLHGIFRDALFKKYEGDSDVTRDGPIPAHLMGNMWSQDWSAYHKLLVPNAEVDLDENFLKTNWTSADMLRRADDFYSSMGLNPMTENFWKLSQFEKTSNTSKCHGSAANMFSDGDYRMIVCAERTFEDLYVIVHEMGHIQYYMHYEKQPAIFQEASNSAIGESIGDAVYLGMLAPSHLNRLGLLSDKFLFTNKLQKPSEEDMLDDKTDAKLLQSATIDLILKRIPKGTIPDPDTMQYLKNSFAERLDSTFEDDIQYGNFDSLNQHITNFLHSKKPQNRDMNAFDLTLLLKTALSKIPQIPFEYILDIFRWDLFSGRVSFHEANEYFWQLSRDEQGIKSPNSEDRRNMFDAAAKFHVADNTPYVRYFLASFLQAQIFKGLCEITVFGRLNTNDKLPMPLHRCDIYGSKRAGRILKKAMKLGASAHWSEVLYILTGTREISVQPLIEYYQPLFEFLNEFSSDLKIPIGW